MANIVYVACSLDGYIAKNDGNIDWLINIPNEDNSDYGFNDFMKRVDGIIMGRKTFEKVLDMDFMEWPYNKPLFVLSTKLKEIPKNLTGKAEIVNDNIENILSELKNKDINNIYVDGGKTIQNFLEKDLIDEMIISTIPIILGNGIPLFRKNNKEIKFVCEKTEYINKYIVKNYYKKNKMICGKTAHNRIVYAAPVAADALFAVTSVPPVRNYEEIHNDKRMPDQQAVIAINFR